MTCPSVYFVLSIDRWRRVHAHGKRYEFEADQARTIVATSAAAVPACAAEG